VEVCLSAAILSILSAANAEPLKAMAIASMEKARINFLLFLISFLDFDFAHIQVAWLNR
jgi:hypothetical protein